MLGLSMRRAAAVGGLIVGAGMGVALSTAPAAAAPDAHHASAAPEGHRGRPKPWPACPHGHARSSYPPRSCHVETDRTAVRPGGEFDVFGLGFRPGEQVVITADGVRLETVPANKDGAVLTHAVVPTSIPPGTHTVTMTSASGNRVSGVIVVKPKLEAATRTSHDSLPFSGPAAAIPLAAAGVMMLASGAVVMSMVRRRRRFLADG